MNEREFHPDVKRLLDGEITIADLPLELRAEGEEALRLLAAVDRSPVSTPAVTWRVMAALERRRQRVRWPLLLVPALAMAAALVLWININRPSMVGPSAASNVVTVRFVLVAPGARHVSLAGTFNHWDPRATPLVRSGAGDLWTATLSLPPGQHQYAFVVDGTRWVPDPTAPAVDDGFGRRNSVLTL
ncbi:MAG TPA: isoamylase early set domain-containing protein [Gemmatimonadales bacterium]|nr:isoamylase early set domain-containing protein [Gemmatimonadales bacterium]